MGLDDHIKDIAGRFAGEGFVALAPDLYHGEFATEPDEARKLVMHMNREQAMKDLAAAVEYLLDAAGRAEEVGCIGFCMGGSLTLALAVNYVGHRRGRAVLRRHAALGRRTEQEHAEMFCAFGADDAGIPMDNVTEVRAAIDGEQRGQRRQGRTRARRTRSSTTPATATDRSGEGRLGNALALFRRTLV